MGTAGQWTRFSYVFVQWWFPIPEECSLCTSYIFYDLQPDLLQRKKGLFVAQVWFQNRRTKWRKRHAAEMAHAKKRQERSTGGGKRGGGAMENEEDEDEEDEEEEDANSDSGEEGDEDEEAPTPRLVNAAQSAPGGPQQPPPPTCFLQF